MLTWPAQRPIGTLRFDNWHPFQIEFDVEGRLYTLGQDAALRFDTKITPENELVISHPRRLMLPNGNAEFAIGRDGRTQVAGYWAGFEMANYAGVWIKSKNEPGARKLLGQESGKFVAVSPVSNDVLCYCVGQTYVCESPEHEPSAFTPSSYADQLEYGHNGDVAMAANSLWNTSDWSRLELADESLKSSAPTRFSEDGKQVVFCSDTGLNHLIDIATGKVFARIEGRLCSLQSDGGAICVTQKGLVYRDLRAIAKNLEQLGLPWEGPEYSETSVGPIQRVVLASEIASLKSCAELMEYVDQQMLADSEANPDDGDAAFGAAMVFIEQREFKKASGET